MSTACATPRPTIAPTSSQSFVLVVRARAPCRSTAPVTPDERDLRRLRADREERPRRPARRAVRAAGTRAGGRTSPVADGVAPALHRNLASGASLHRTRASSAWTCTSRAAPATRSRLAGAFSQPLAPDGCGSGIATRAVELEPPADALGEARQAEQPPDREAADGDDQRRARSRRAPTRARTRRAPARAASACGRRGRRRLPGVAARDRGAVEGRVELVLVQLEPAAQRLAGAAAPGAALLALDDPRRLAEHVRALAGAALDDRQRLERVAGLDARAADAVVALERGERAVRDRRRVTSGRRRTSGPREDLAAAELLGELPAGEEALVDRPARAVVQRRAPATRSGSTSSRERGVDDDELAARRGAPRRGTARARRSSSGRRSGR